MDGQGYPMVATPRPGDDRRRRSRTGHASSGRGADEFECQMLYGIRDAEQRRLVDAGNQHVRVYMPYGERVVRLLHASARRAPGQPGVLPAVTDLNEIANLGRTFATLETVAWQRLRCSAAPMWCHPMCG